MTNVKRVHNVGLSPPLDILSLPQSAYPASLTVLPCELGAGAVAAISDGKPKMEASCLPS